MSSRMNTWPRRKSPGVCFPFWWERKKPMPYVNHYSFHILDPGWGQITIKISGHPPFPAQVILNGHEYVAARRAKRESALQKRQLFCSYPDLAGPGEDRRHLVRTTDYRAAKPSLRALDLYHLPVLRARPRRAEAERISLPILELLGGVQPEPGFRDRRRHGSGLSGTD
jgi:hypothetical protein